MNDHYWMYRVLFEGLHKMDYCNGIGSFIKYELYNATNISGGDIKRCKNKKFSRYRCYYDA